MPLLARLWEYVELLATLVAQVQPLREPASAQGLEQQLGLRLEVQRPPADILSHPSKVVAIQRHLRVSREMS